MADVAGGGAGAPAGGQSGGQGGAPAAAPSSPGRARIGDFNSFSAGLPVHTEPSQQPAPRPTLQRSEDANDPWSPLVGEDAQGQAIVVDDSQPSQVLDDKTQDDYDTWKTSHEQWQALQMADDLPQDLSSKFVTVSVNGVKERVPVSEAIAGYMMQRDYSNGKRDLQVYEAGLIQRENGLRRFLADLDQGPTFLDAMVAIGKFPGFHQAALIYGTQLAAEQQMSPQQREIHKTNRALDARAKQLARENAALQARLQGVQQQDQQAPTVERIYHQCAQLIPKAAKLTGFVDSELHKKCFEYHFDKLLPTLKNGDISTEFLVMVMKAAMQEADILISQSSARQLQAATREPSASPGLSSQPNGTMQSTNGQQIQRNGVRRERIENFGRSVTGR